MRMEMVYVIGSTSKIIAKGWCYCSCKALKLRKIKYNFNSNINPLGLSGEIRTLIQLEIKTNCLHMMSPFAGFLNSHQAFAIVCYSEGTTWINGTKP